MLGHLRSRQDEVRDVYLPSPTPCSQTHRAGTDRMQAIAVISAAVA